MQHAIVEPNLTAGEWERGGRSRTLAHATEQARPATEHRLRRQHCVRGGGASGAQSPLPPNLLSKRASLSLSQWGRSLPS